MHSELSSIRTDFQSEKKSAVSRKEILEDTKLSHLFAQQSKEMRKKSHAVLKEKLHRKHKQ